jgi:hypothetical protein
MTIAGNVFLFSKRFNVEDWNISLRDFGLAFELSCWLRLWLGLCVHYEIFILTRTYNIFFIFLLDIVSYKTHSQWIFILNVTLIIREINAKCEHSEIKSTTTCHAYTFLFSIFYRSYTRLWPSQSQDWKKTLKNWAILTTKELEVKKWSALNFQIPFVVYMRSKRDRDSSNITYIFLHFIFVNILP